MDDMEPSFMPSMKAAGPWRVLIVSSHPLFAEGLRSLLSRRVQADVAVVGIATSIHETTAAIQALQPDLVIVDHDDERVNRAEFLARFVEGEGSLRVVLISLKAGGDEAILYDRRTLAASQIDEWLEKWNDLDRPHSQAGAAGRAERQYPQRREGMKHVVGASLIVILLMIVGLVGLRLVNLLPVEASLQARSVDGLFGLHFVAIVVLFALIVGLMVYSILAFRRRSGDTSDGPHVEGNTRLEVAWTLVPLAFVLYVAFMGSAALGEIQRSDPRPLEVNVIGMQWTWQFEYPDYGIFSTELVLPEHKQILLRLTSNDVIHSFWVPEFRVKQDALPGGQPFIRELRITPTRLGEYKVRCAELCGLNHATMESPVKVVTQAEFETWLASKSGAAQQPAVALP
jgi:cytochrome c oxidase subunit 2